MTTATAVDSTSAAAAATKTSSGGVSRPEAKSTVASWVLSPSSARNTVAKMARIWDIFLDLSGAGFGHHDAPSGPAPCARRNVAGLAKSKGSPRTMSGLGSPAKSVDAGPRFTTGERGGYRSEEHRVGQESVRTVRTGG